MEKDTASPTFEYLSSLPVFGTLPEQELRALSTRLVLEKYPRGALLGIQSKTPVEKILILQGGEIELFFEKDGVRTLRGSLGGGDIFGGICLLTNKGVAVRTAVVREDATVLSLAADIFLDLCKRHKVFADHFLETFHERMLDQDYASCFKQGQVFHFLSGIPPFSFLPEDVLRSVANQLSAERSKKGTVLFVQGSSKVERLYIIKSGAVERYNQENGEKKLRGMLGEGDLYGGISMLLNNGISVRTVVAREDSQFYTLPEAQFLSLCREHRSFSEFFTDAFGKRMIDRTFAAVIKSGSDSGMPSSQFFNLRVRDIYHGDLLACRTTATIQEAAAAMSRRGCSSIFVQAPDGDFTGVVTDNDLRKKVIAPGLDLRKPVSAIMSCPLRTIEADAMVSEALLAMMDAKIKHLGVTDHRGRVQGVLTNSDLLSAQEQSPFFIIREIAATSGIQDILGIQKRVPSLIHNMINSGAKSRITARLISKISDAILLRIIGLALEQLGNPPVPFAFMVMGSEGRMEQTLKTDQDNAIVFADVPHPQEHAKIKNYFEQLGTCVCAWLDQAGYAYCKGGIMAQNPRWCQPLSVWKETFRRWVRVSTPTDLMQSAIFFDFRGAYGDSAMIEALRTFLFETLAGMSRFFKDLTLNALGFRPPIGFFRNFVLESRGEHRNQFNLKNAMTPIVDFARIFALHHAIPETNTQERLYQLHLREVLQAHDYNDLDQAYNYLMQYRLLSQINRIERGAPPQNYINPKSLTRIEQTLLKEIFKRIEGAQARLDMEFTGGLR